MKPNEVRSELLRMIENIENKIEGRGVWSGGGLRDLFHRQSSRIDRLEGIESRRAETKDTILGIAKFLGCLIVGTLAIVGLLSILFGPCS